MLSRLTYLQDTFRSSPQHLPPPWCPMWSPGLQTGLWCSERSWWWGWSERPGKPDRCHWWTVTVPAWRPPGSDRWQRRCPDRSCDDPYSAGGSGCFGSGRPWPPDPGTDSGTNSAMQDTPEGFGNKENQTRKHLSFPLYGRWHYMYSYRCLSLYIFIVFSEAYLFHHELWPKQWLSITNLVLITRYSRPDKCWISPHCSGMHGAVVDRYIQFKEFEGLWLYCFYLF